MDGTKTAALFKEKRRYINTLFFQHTIKLSERRGNAWQKLPQEFFKMVSRLLSEH